uniref:Golgin subfamily A member 1 isoform X2 n=1 Tax=Tetranychus evansi TaxID=178897 RepID=A0A3G5ARR9_9ACAR|nr:golgin subfamily A member 1 isoform X2 [Tetranychus evansi]
MFKNLKQKLASEKAESTSLSSDCDDVNLNQQINDESLLNHNYDNSEMKKTRNATRPVIKSSFSSLDISNNHPESALNSASIKPTSISSMELDESSIKFDDRKKLLWENERLRDQIRVLSNKLESSTSEKQVGYIDEKLLKLVGESIVKESSEQSKEANGIKSSYGNWSLLLSPSNKDETNNSNGDLHKQEVEKLQRRINELEESLREKNKTIRLQQQRLNDIRKSFQRGSTLDSKLFDIPGSQNDNEIGTNDGSSRILAPSRSENGFADQQQSQSPQQQQQPQHQRQLSDSQTSMNYLMNDISFQYLRSVVFKFVLTSDYEAQKHLIKAISMLLKFSDVEERQIRDSLEQRVSWFKSLPLLGNGFKMNSNYQPSNSAHH